MRADEQLERPTRDAAARLADAGQAAAHFAEIARALVEMGEMATSISSSAGVESAEASAVRRFLPELAARYGIRARVEGRRTVLTVTFARSHNVHATRRQILVDDAAEGLFVCHQQHAEAAAGLQRSADRRTR